MELYSHERTPDFSYARIGYHYGRPGLTDDHVNITDEDVRHLELPENWVPAARMGSRGAKFFEAEDVITDKRNTTSCESNLWTRGSMLVWRPAKKGEEISFELPVEETGRYLIRLTTARTPESGKISVRLDDKAIGIGGPEGIVDLKTEFRTLSRNLSSGPLELTKGKHPLTIQNESDTPGIIGIDFIWVQKQ